MLTDLALPFVDTRAGALGWWLGDGPAPLASVVLDGPAGRLELQVLGASHRVVASVAGVLVPEVVACGRAGAVLPARHEVCDGRVRYRFASGTTRYDRPGLARTARDLKRRWADDAGALIGVFPGSPHALTVVRGAAVPTGWAWATWHVYPGSGEVVRTRGRLEAA